MEIPIPCFLGYAQLLYQNTRTLYFSSQSQQSAGIMHVVRRALIRRLDLRKKPKVLSSEFLPFEKIKQSDGNFIINSSIIKLLKHKDE